MTKNKVYLIINRHFLPILLFFVQVIFEHATINLKTITNQLVHKVTAATKVAFTNCVLALIYKVKSQNELLPI